MQAPDHITPLPDTHVDNGVLARVPGQYISRAGRTLPDPATATEDTMHAEVETTAEWCGRVRLTFKRRRYSRPRAKTSYFAWHCTHAEPISSH